MKNLIDALQERGFIDQMTHSELREKVKQPIGVYVGFDPTADSLHLGNMVGIMALAWCQKMGHTPYVLIGGATGRIGDPSGKSTERPLLSEEAIASNVRSIELFFQNLFYGSRGPAPVILNNNDWLGSFSLIDFLRDVGKHFRVGPMLAKESVRARLQSEEGISFTEFTYQVLQAYDFHYLSQKHSVLLQMGGSDQWGNITAGVEFNRKLGGETLYGMTFPLLTRSDGKKFGKSEEGAIWLSSHRLSPYQFYQYLVRISDADVIRLLKMLTFLEMSEIEAIERHMQAVDYVPNTAQKRLAEEVTRFIHKEEGLQAALRVTEGIAPGAEAKLDGATLQELAKDMPNATLSVTEVVGHKFIDVAARVAFIPSKSEGVRLVKNGGLYLNNQRVSDPGFLISDKDLIEGSYLLLSAGKKKRLLVTVHPR